MILHINNLNECNTGKKKRKVHQKTKPKPTTKQKNTDEDKKTGQNNICHGIMNNWQEWYFVTKTILDYISKQEIISKGQLVQGMIK